jgi:lysophospholipid hydrolase
LDEDSISEAGLGWVPPELTYLLNSFHMFGHFDQALFLELCQKIQSVHLPSGQYLFKRGDPDDYVYVIKSGKVNVHIVTNDATGNEISATIKDVGPGEPVTSLLSFIDCLTGNSHPFRTVCCKALTDSVVIKLPATAFIDVFDKNPDMMIKVVQLIMARLQRVVFVALHQYLGLTTELVKPSPKLEVSADNTPSESPSKVNMSLLIEAAVRGFKMELDFDNTEFLRDR